MTGSILIHPGKPILPKDVVIGVIYNERGQVLVHQRHDPSFPRKNGHSKLIQLPAQRAS